MYQCHEQTKIIIIFENMTVIPSHRSTSHSSAIHIPVSNEIHDREGTVHTELFISRFFSVKRCSHKINIVTRVFCLFSVPPFFF